MLGRTMKEKFECTSFWREPCRLLTVVPLYAVAGGTTHPRGTKSSLESPLHFMSWRWLPIVRGHRLLKAKVVSIFVLGSTLFFFRALHLAANITLPADNDDGRFARTSGGVSRRGDDAATGNTSATPSTYPIYIVDISSIETLHVLGWSDLSNEWRSNSSYSDILNSSHSVKMNTILQSSPNNYSHRSIFILHNHPKMASTTLRRACWESLKSSCNTVSSSRDPMGYSNANDLAKLFEQCRKTHYFCIGGWHYNAENFPNQTSRSSLSSVATTVTFLHMFPFRNFNDWATSALKQIFVGHSDDGCRQVSKRLDACSGGWLELDFEKYTKRTMANMIDIVNLHDHNNNNNSEPQKHMFFLYDFRLIQPTLASLSHVLNFPTLPHLEMKYKQNRREGSCPIETLRKFHDCFDKQLDTI